MSQSLAQTTISSAIVDLRQLTQISVQSSWQCCNRDWAAQQLDQGDWAIATLNDKQHIAWEKGQKVRWLRQVITVPADLQDYPLQGLSLRIALTWWTEAAQVFVNGELVQEGHPFDSQPQPGWAKI